MTDEGTYVRYLAEPATQGMTADQAMSYVELRIRGFRGPDAALTALKLSAETVRNTQIRSLELFVQTHRAIRDAEENAAKEKAMWEAAERAGTPPTQDEIDQAIESIKRTRREEA